MTRKYLFLFALVAMISLSLSSCSDDKDDPKVTNATLDYTVTINSVNFGTDSATAQHDILVDYHYATDGKEFSNTDAILEVTDKVYAQHKEQYANGITSGNVAVTVDGTVIKTYDYSFAKPLTVTVSPDSLITIWRLSRISDDNGAGWVNSTYDWNAFNGYRFYANGNFAHYNTGEDEYETFEGTYSLDGNVLTFNFTNDLGESATTTTNIVYFSSDRMVLRAPNTKMCYEYRPQIYVRYVVTVSSDLKNLLSNKVIKYYGTLNKVEEMPLLTYADFGGEHWSYPVKAGMDFDYTIDESAYTEGTSVNLSYTWEIRLTRGVDYKEFIVEERTNKGTFTSMADIKKFVEGMRTSMYEIGILINNDGRDLEYNFDELGTK